MRYHRNYIDGAWVDGGAGRLPIEDPASGEIVGEQALADLDDVDRVVAAARACVESRVSTAMRPNECGHMVHRLLEPMFFTGVTPNITIPQEEAFSPMLSAMPISDDAEGTAIANGADRGLVAGVFTEDVKRATRHAQPFRAGQVFVNECFVGGVERPFGGYGKSGYGREKGREALWN